MIVIAFLLVMFVMAMVIEEKEGYRGHGVIGCGQVIGVIEKDKIQT